MRDLIFEQLYANMLNENAGEQQKQAVPQQAPTKNAGLSLDQARQITAEALTTFTNTLTEKQVGDQEWAKQVFQEVGKVMSNKLQDKFSKAPDSSGPPKPQEQPQQPTNPQPQAQAQNQ